MGPPKWVCPCQYALWREYYDPAHVPLTIDMALHLSISAFAFRKDQRDTFVDVVSSAAKIKPHRVEIMSVEDVEASALADGVHVNFTITVPGAEEKLVEPMLAALTMETLTAGLAEKGLPTLIAVVKACVDVDVCVCGGTAPFRGYECSGGTSTSADECTSVCGDGIKTASEECDDNNSNNNDGCDSACFIEAGYTCSTPECALSVCGTVCGDGYACICISIYIHIDRQTHGYA